MKILTDEEINTLDCIEQDEFDYVKDESVFKFAHAIEAAILAKIGEPVAWREFDGEGGYDYRSYQDNEAFRDDYRKRNPNQIYHDWVEPLYSIPEVK